MNSRVSIVIPAFNAERWLGEAIASALAQDWPDKEILVVDDGSRDGTARVARGFEGQGVRLLRQANRGAAAARNAGLAAAGGDFLQFLDADDLLAPSKIRLQVEALRASAPGAVAAGAWGVFSGRPEEARFVPEPVWRDLAPAEWLACSWEGGGMMHPAAWLTPRAVAERAGGWNEALSLDDDGEYFCRVVLASGGVRFVPEARSLYRSHSGPRLSGSAGRRAAESSFLSVTLKERHLLAAEDSPRTRRAAAANYSRFAWEQLGAAPELADRAERRWRELAPDLPPPRAGRLHNLAAALFGWRRARRWQLRLHP